MFYKSSIKPFILLILIFSVLFCSSERLFSEKNNPEIVIIKATGFEDGKKPEGADAITEATSVGRNVHVVSQALQNAFRQVGLRSEVIRFNEYARINKISTDKSIRLIIFAGPAYSSQFPGQLKEVVPKLQKHILQHKILCTSVTTCRFMDSGWKTVQSFNQELQGKGIRTIEGLAIHHEYEDKDWESKVESFMQTLMNTIAN